MTIFYYCKKCDKTFEKYELELGVFMSDVCPVCYGQVTKKVWSDE